MALMIAYLLCYTGAAWDRLKLISESRSDATAQLDEHVYPFSEKLSMLVSRSSIPKLSYSSL